MGVIYRANDGSYMGASAISFEGVFVPASLKAMPCREALALAADLMQTHVIIASDWKEVVSNIVEGNGGKRAHIIREIKLMALDLQFYFIFIFEPRASNIEAHSLARNALKLSVGRHVCLLQPLELSWSIS